MATWVECRDVQVPIYGAVCEISDRSRSAVRRSFTSPTLPEGVYEIRIKRVAADDPGDYVADTVFVSDINEIITEDVTYKHTALVGLKVQLTDQLSGPPKVTYLNHGRLIRVWDGLVWRHQASANPAWITLDMMTHGRYGGGMLSSRIDMDKWKEWATYCDAQGLTFNGVIETQSNLWDAMQYVFRAGHAQIVNIGTRYTVIIEKASSAVQMFSVANIIKGTFKQGWLPVTERANEIEVSYFDKMDNYKKNSIKVYDPVALTNGTTLRGSSITLLGVDTKEQAHKEGVLQLNLNRYVLQTVEFAAPIESIAATVGDVIYVQHDMPQWGYAGRVDSPDTTTSINLDRPVPMAPGVSYKLLMFFDAIQRQAGTITSVIGNSIILGSYAGATNIKRLKANGLDLEVESVFTAGASYGVIVADSTGLANGQAYTLWDTDVIEERDVTNAVMAPIETSEVSVAWAFSVAPEKFTNWMYGPVDKVKKPFRIKTISGSHDYRRDIAAIEYNDSVYDLDSIPAPVVNFSNLSPVVTQATIDDISEILVMVGGVIRSEVSIHFSSTLATYKDSKVYVSRNGAPYEYVTSHFERATIEADTSDVLIFKVVATDMVGASAPDTAAPTETYTVIGKTAPPGNATGLAYTHLATGTKLTWNAVTDVDFDHYKVKVGSTWALGTVVYEGSDPRYTTPLLSAGSYIYHVKAVDTSDNESLLEDSEPFTVTAPTIAGFDKTVSGENYNLKWTLVAGTYPLKHFILKQGASWGGGVVIATNDAINYTGKANWGINTETFFVAAFDVANNEGTPVSQTVTIAALPAPTDITSTNLDISNDVTENLTISWVPPVVGATNLAIFDYEVRFGADFNSGTSLGRVLGTRLTIKIDWVGLRTFWIAARDVGQNLGTSVSTPKTITIYGAPSVSTPVIIALKAELVWSIPTGGSLPIDEYEIRYGTSFTHIDSVLVARTQSRNYRVPIDWVGIRNFWIAAIDSNKQVGTAGTNAVAIGIPYAPDNVSASLDNADFVLRWDAAVSDLPIEEYEIKYGVSFDAGTSIGRVKGTTIRGAVNWGGARNFWIKAFNQNGAGGGVGSATLTILNPLTANVAEVNLEVVDNNVLIKWPDAKSSLPIKHYEIRKGATFGASELIGTVLGRFASVFETSSGTYTYWIQAFDIANNFNTVVSKSATVAQPPDYVLYNQLNSQLDSTTSTNVSLVSPRHYAINLDGSTQYGSVASVPDLDSGITGLTMECWVKPNQSADNTQGFMDKTVGGTTNTCAELFAYSASTIAARVVIAAGLYDAAYTYPANRVNTWMHLILRWSSANGVQLAMDGVNVATLAAAGTLDQGAGALFLGRLGATSGYSTLGQLGPCRVYKRRISDTEILEHYRGIYKDESAIVGSWGFDTGSGTTVFDDTDNAFNVALTGAPTWSQTTLDGRYDITEPHALYHTVNPDKTFAEHFTDQAATTTQDLITAGYTHGLAPAPTTGNYTEVIDYGTTIPSTKISVSLNTVAIVGTVTITPKISYKLNWGDSWTDFPGVYSAFATNFRYVKVTLDFSSAGGNHISKTIDMIVKLDVKLINDAGSITCASGDTGGTTVTFNVDFVDVNSITVTPAGTTPVIATYDFVDTPNPTDFKILLFDRATGARVSGLASWQAKGV